MTSDAERVLIWTPSGRDATLAAQMLERQGVASATQTDVRGVIDGMMTAGCAIIASEALTDGARDSLVAALSVQPAWSDFPIILLVPRGTGIQRASDATHAIRLLGNVTLLERPVQARTLLTAIESARRARRRQYESREAIHSRDQFLAMLGHELRNPLAAIVLALESLELVGGDAGVKQRRIIDRQSRHLARLVDDLLDVARVTTGKVTLQLDDVDLADIVQRCVQSAELAARERKISLRVDVGSEPMNIRGDAVRLEEIFNNLVTNALKYSPAGSRVDVYARCEADVCAIAVRDTGIGIAPEMLPRVFDLFAQAESSLARSQGGLGIGLTLVRSLVELHEGSVTATSDGLGHGSTFTVRLPRAKPAQAAAPTLKLVPPTHATRIVLVDDNEDILEMTKELLERSGCTVFTALDGLAGIAAIAEHRPDVAVVDIGLPGTDGYEVARKVNELPHVPYLVALTGYGQHSDRERALAAGFDDHVIKPVTIDRLRKLLDQPHAARRNRGHTG